MQQFNLLLVNVVMETWNGLNESEDTTTVSLMTDEKQVQKVLLNSEESKKKKGFDCNLKLALKRRVHQSATRGRGSLHNHRFHYNIQTNR